jgi:O-antigen ligase
LKPRAAVALLVLAGVFAYVVFEWGGVVRTGRYEYLLALGLLGIVLSLSRAREDVGPPPSRIVRSAAILLPAYVFLQVVPLPLAILRVLSPARASAVIALNPVGAKVTFASLSVYPAGTFQYFLLVCGYLLVSLLVRDLTICFPNSPWVLVWPVLAVAALESVLGLCQHFGGPGEQVRWGTYANHNHYAGLLEMALPFAVMYPFAILHKSRSWWHSRMAPALAACGACALAGLILTGILFSSSRMGFIAAGSSLFLMGSLVFGARKLGWLARSRTRRGVAVGALAAMTLSCFVFLPPDRLIVRFAELFSADGLTTEGRTSLWAETIPLIRAYPVFGCGLGGYGTAFSKFDVSGPLYIDEFAHNDYLQLLAELGLVGFIVCAALAFSIVRAAFLGAVRLPGAQARYLAVACAGALAAIGLHSFVDFNLYIPANAMLLAWIAGTICAGRFASEAHA